MYEFEPKKMKFIQKNPKNPGFWSKLRPTRYETIRCDSKEIRMLFCWRMTRYLRKFCRRWKTWFSGYLYEKKKKLDKAMLIIAPFFVNMHLENKSDGSKQKLGMYLLYLKKWIILILWKFFITATVHFQLISGTLENE